MFGIHKKLYNIFALISMIIGIVILALVVFDVFGENKDLISIMNLISLIFLFLSVALYIRPKMKYMKITNQLQNQFRNDLYSIILDDNKNKIIDKITFVQVDDTLVYQGKKQVFTFEGLSLYEATVIALNLMKELAYIMYAKVDEKKPKKLSKEAMISDFTV